MDIHNRSGLSVGWCVSQVNGLTATLIAKGTFRLRPDAPAVLAERQEPLGGDVLDESGVLRYPSDFAWMKPRADLLLSGTCHVPRPPDTVCRVTFLVGRWQKQIAVIGERTRRRRFLIFETVTDPLPFTTQRLSYEFAFGGPAYSKNPHGRGYSEMRMPNIEDPGRLIIDAETRPDPAGYGPIPLAWPQRFRGMGTFDKRWLETRWPGLPADCDWTVFNSAPPDQQLVGFLRGDEKLAFEHLHPKHAIYKSALPGLRVRWALDGREVEMKLDTLWVDMDAEQLVLVWRGVTPIAHRKMREIQDHVIVAEPLSAPRPALATPAEPAVAEERVPSVAEVTHAQMQAIWQSLPPEIAKKVGPPPAPDLKEAVLKGEDLRGADLSGRDLTGAVLAAADLREARLTGAKLTGADLAGADLRGAILEGAEFEQAELSGANLSGTRVTALRGARLYGANLDGADLSGACLAGADLGTASLAKANLEGADLTGASLVGARAPGVRAKGANLTGASAAGADLTEGKFASIAGERSVWDEAKLDGADFERATLARASFAGASLPRASFRFADLREARLSEAKLAGAKLHQTNLFRADLEGADLTAAEVLRSNLYGAELWRATTTAAEFGQSDLTGTKLESR